jgi:hypothetical protein
MYRLYIFILLSTVSILLGKTATTELSPIEILARSDAARGNLDGVQWHVEINENSTNKTTSRSLLVKARGFDMVAVTLAPARQKGQKLLLAQNNMWFYKPGLSKPVPVSLRQKLAGQAANGDIASTNYAQDYDIISVEESNLNNEDCYLFDLKANSKSVTYENIRYWISKDRLVGLRADYFTTSGVKRLKTAEMKYENTILSRNIITPFISEMTIYDTLISSTYTQLLFTQPKLGAISSRDLNVNSLKRQ